MTGPAETLPRRSRLGALLDHVSPVEDPRTAARIPAEQMTPAKAVAFAASAGLRDKVTVLTNWVW